MVGLVVVLLLLPSFVMLMIQDTLLLMRLLTRPSLPNLATATFFFGRKNIVVPFYHVHRMLHLALRIANVPQRFLDLGPVAVLIVTFAEKVRT